jgi:hypothetical protein
VQASKSSVIKASLAPGSSGSLKKQKHSTVRSVMVLHFNDSRMNGGAGFLNSAISQSPKAPLITRQATKEFAQYKRAKGKNGGEEFEDDGNYGSAAIADVAVLQVISKRIHYGKLVFTLPRFCSALNMKAISLDGFSKTSVTGSRI